jgi:predicted MFS family arabinose efflux permease
MADTEAILGRVDTAKNTNTPKAPASDSPSGVQDRTISKRLVFILAVCTGMSAASLYYAQPLLHSIKVSLHLGTATAGLIVTITQVGYIAGLVLVVPLGDMFARRRLLPLMVAGIALALLGVSFSPDGALLLLSSVVVGALSVAAQITVAFAATLAPDASRGRVVGTVMSGLLLGILLARTVAGYLADLGSWRTPFQVAAAVMVVMAVVLSRVLPREGRRPPINYLRALTSVPALLVEEPLIRRRAVYGAASFGAFNALWTPLAFLLSGSPYHYATSTIGLFGLFGVVGAVTASFAGRFADRGGAGAMTAVTSVLLAVSWISIGFARTSLVALIVGVIVVDFASQGLHITNQSQIYRLRPEARSRITATYMSVYFVGGVLGSFGASTAYAAGGWVASSTVGGAFGALAVGLWVFGALSGGEDHLVSARAGRMSAERALQLEG